MNVSLHITGEIGVIELLSSDDILKNQNIFIFSREDIPDIQVKNFLRRDGVNGFLKKPIILEELLTVITKWGFFEIIFWEGWKLARIEV